MKEIPVLIDNKTQIYRIADKPGAIGRIYDKFYRFYRIYKVYRVAGKKFVVETKKHPPIQITI